MTMTLGASAPTRRRQPLLLVPLVPLLLIAGYLVWIRVVLYHLVPRYLQHWPSNLLGLLRFLLETSPYVLLALVLLAWGRSARQRLAGAACAVVAGLVDWGLNEGYSRLFVHQGHITANQIRAFDWSLTLVIPTLVTLAWGLARRSGYAWLLGVLVASALAWGHRMLQLHNPNFVSWEFHHGQWWVSRLEFLAPMVLACLVCWLIEWMREPEDPEIGSSA
jgi:hypothetical protein